MGDRLVVPTVVLYHLPSARMEASKTVTGAYNISKDFQKVCRFSHFSKKKTHPF